MALTTSTRPWILPATAAACVLLAGCGEADFGAGTCPEGCPGSADAGPAGPDAGTAPSVDAEDSPPLPAVEPSDPGFAAGESADDVARNAGSCYDGQDNDAAGGTDCEDAGCASLGSCCVGSGDCCAPLGDAAPVPQILHFPATCPGEPTATCLAGQPVIAFGSPSPWIRDGMLHPGGDASYDSGLLVGDRVDLGAMKVDIATSFGTAAACSATCLEGAGVAFTEQTTFDDSTHVRPLVGLLASGARDAVSLVLSDDVVASWPLEGPTQRWRMVLRPTGSVEVYRNDESAPLDTFFFPAVSSAQLVLYGRNRNPTASAPDGSRIGDLSVATGLCNMPSAWRSRDPLFVAQPPLPEAFGSGHARAASVAQGPTRLSMVFEDRHRLYFAQRTAGDETRFALVHPSGDPVLEPSRPFDEQGVRDPELLWDGARWVVFYTAESASGQRTIARAESADPAVADFADQAVVLVPDGVPFAHYSMPSVVILPRDPSVWIMAVRADRVGGGHELALFVSSDAGRTFERHWSSGLSNHTRRGFSTETGFDADEVGQPSLVVHEGAYHLYYAGRRGTRWRIGLLASDELVHWRQVADGEPVLSGVGEGADRAGVGDPDVIVGDGRLELFYTGSDGARSTLFRALRLSRSGGGS